MNVSPDFSPPIRTTAPYFVIGTLFHVVSALALLALDLPFAPQEFAVLGWVHLYMLGFVMTVIFAAMAQLVPVLGETDHAHRWTLRAVWPLLLAGTLLLAAGFYAAPAALAYGAAAILLAMILFTYNLQRTLDRSRRRTAVIVSMKVSTLFLVVGIVSGGIMALSLGGVIGVNVFAWLKAHVFAVFGGYVMISVMGVSTVLLPMFGRARRISENAFAKSFYTMIAAVSLMVLGALAELPWLELAALAAAMGSAAFYLVLVAGFARSRRKAEYDIWSLCAYVAFSALGIAWLLGLGYLFTGNETLLMSAFWLLITGFMGFLIAGHLYKIVPFLVWFEYYAPLVGERDVPLLHEMIDDKRAKIQFAVSLAGLLAATAGLVAGYEALFKAGALAMAAGAALLAANVIAVLRSEAPTS